MFAGKLIEKKYPLNFLEALRRIRQKRTDVWGLIVGDGPLKAAVDDYRRAHDIPCAIAGFQNQRRIASTYAAADALVLPSTWGETWGLVVNEAMACGLPVIVSDRPVAAPISLSKARPVSPIPAPTLRHSPRASTRSQAIAVSVTG